MTPRKLQVVAFRELMLGTKQGHQRQTVVAPPGFGKSLLGLMFAGHLVERGVDRFDGESLRYKGALIVVPTLALMPTFTSLSSIEVPAVDMPPQKIAPYELDVTPLWRQSIGAKPSSTTEVELRNLFRHGGLSVMTYQSLHQLWELVPKDLRQWHLHVDEAHHVPLARQNGEHWTEIASKRDEWQRRGGSVLQASATPWHTASGRRVYEEEEPRTVVSIGELRRAGLAPENFELHRVMLDIEAETLKEMLLEGEPSDSLVAAYAAIPQYWIAQGRPVVGIRPPDRSHVEPLRAAFVAAGVAPERILDATGDDFDAASLAAERECDDYKKRRYDIIIACRRLDEGTDVPTLSNIYYLGAPTSVRLVIQLLGRTLRPKQQAGYPMRWRSRSAMTIFIPRGDAAAKEYLEVHKYDATMLAAYIADVEVGDTIITTLADRLRESFVQGHRDDSARRRATSRICGDDVTRAEASAALDEIIRTMGRERGEAEVRAEAVGKKLVSIAKVGGIKITPSLRSAMIAVFCERLERTDPQQAERVQKLFADAIDEIRANEDLDAQIHAAYTTLIEGFRVVTEAFGRLHKMGTDHGILHVLSRFTGLDAEEIAKQLRRLCMPNPTRGEVARAVQSHVARTGAIPRADSGSTELDGLPGYTWRLVDRHWDAFGFEEDSLREYGQVISGKRPRGRRRTQR